MALPNGLNPSINRLVLPGNVVIHAGSSGYDDATIKTILGTPGTDVAAGSIYISTNAGTPGVWVAVSTTWTKLTIN